jgi:hypothetical protein
MNKGLEIRAKKLKKKAEKRNTVKEKQLGVCRFIEFRNPRTQRVNGKYQFVGFQTLTGLQIENKLYYVENDKEKYVFMNKPQAKVFVVYSENEIHNFHPLLLQRYNEIKNKAKNVIEDNITEE